MVKVLQCLFILNTDREVRPQPVVLESHQPQVLLQTLCLIELA
jgi:hypothetical protein